MRGAGAGITGAAMMCKATGLWAALAVMAAPVVADDWPQWLGPRRDGVSKEAGWRAAFDANGPPRLWETNVGLGYSSVAVVGGRLYTLGNRSETDTLYCFNAETGALIWKYPYACSATAPRKIIKLYPGTRSTPTVAGGRVYSFSRDGRLFCLDAVGGTLCWSLDVRDKPIAAAIPSWGFACSPLVLDKWVVLDAGPILAVDKASGKLAWKSKAYPAAYSSPVALSLAGRGCIATLNGSGLTVVDAADGNQLCLYPFSFGWIENCVTPLLAGQRCFISAGQRPGSALLKLSADGASEVWRGSGMLNVSTNSVLWAGCLYGFHGSALGAKSLRCVDFETGEKKWNTRLIRNGALMIADGKLIALGEKGELVIAPAEPGGLKPLTRVKVLGPTCWAVPVLANGRIYCRNSAGDLVCLDVRAK